MNKTFYGTLRGTETRIKITVAPADLNEHGRTKPLVTDLLSGRQYATKPKSCGLSGCMCELWLKPAWGRTVKTTPVIRMTPQDDGTVFYIAWDRATEDYDTKNLLTPPEAFELIRQGARVEIAILDAAGTGETIWETRTGKFKAS